VVAPSGVGVGGMTPYSDASVALLSQPLLPPPESPEVAQGMLLAFVLGLAVALLYRIAVPGRTISIRLQGALVMLAMVSAMVMFAVGNSLARAFGLVGALAIIRFRTQIASPWDVTFVFLSLAAGISVGVGALQVELVGTGICALAVLALYVLPISGIRGELFSLRCDLAAYQATEQAATEIIDRHVRRRWLVEARSLRFGETLSLRYRVEIAPGRANEALLQEMSGLDGVERVLLTSDDAASDIEQA